MKDEDIKRVAAALAAHLGDTGEWDDPSNWDPMGPTREDRYEGMARAAIAAMPTNSFYTAEEAKLIEEMTSRVKDL